MKEMKTRDYLSSILTKPLILFLWLFWAISGYGFAQDVRLAWDPNPETDLVGYSIYRCGPLSASQTTCPKTPTLNFVKLNSSFIPVSPSPTYTDATNLVFGNKYAWVATASNSSGLESDFSNEVVYTVVNPNAPQPPANFRVSAVGPSAYLNWDALSNTRRYEIWARPVTKDSSGQWVMQSTWNRVAESPYNYYVFNQFKRPAAFQVRGVLEDGRLTPYSNSVIYVPTSWNN